MNLFCSWADDEFPEAEQIQKHLEVCSYDEYDDFKPRHPLPKEKVLPSLSHSETALFHSIYSYPPWATESSQRRQLLQLWCGCVCKWSCGGPQDLRYEQHRSRSHCDRYSSNQPLHKFSLLFRSNFCCNIFIIDILYYYFIFTLLLWIWNYYYLVEEVDGNAIKNKFLSRKKSTLTFEHTHVTTNKFPGSTCIQLISTLNDKK